MTQKKAVKQKLEDSKEFRERTLREKEIWILALEACGLYEKYMSGKQLPPQDMIAYGKKYDSICRAWRGHTKDNKQFQGNDYGDKVKLEQEHQLAMGYQPMHYQVKQQVLLK